MVEQYIIVMLSEFYQTIIFLFFFRLHIGINRLYIIELFEAFHHFVNGFALFRSHVLLVIRNISELTSDILESAHSSKCFWIAA